MVALMVMRGRSRGQQWGTVIEGLSNEYGGIKAHF